jgi:hypothetical protein
MDPTDPDDLYRSYLDWCSRLGGDKKSRHHLIPRCRWEDMQNFIESTRISGLKRGECIITSNERHALWHCLFNIRTPLEIILLIKNQRMDFGRMNEWQIISWLVIFEHLEAKDACFHAGLIQPGRLTDQKTIRRAIELIVRQWSPSIFRDFGIKELLAMAALFILKSYFFHLTSFLHCL